MAGRRRDLLLSRAKDRVARRRIHKPRLSGPLDELLAAIDADVFEYLRLPARPADRDVLDVARSAKPEMEPLARLGQETLSGAERADKRPS